MDIKDIMVEQNFNAEWDDVIIDALKEGSISHAKVQKAIGGSYAKAGRLIDLAIQYGYFDNKQQAKIDVKEYEDMVANREKKDFYDIDPIVPESIVDFKYLRPSKENLNEYKKWLADGRFTLKDIEDTETFTSWDIREDCLQGDDLWYYLELFYWAMAYGIKQFPEEYTDDVNQLDMINREKYDIGFENWAIVLTVKETGEKIVLSNYGPPENDRE